MFWWAAVQRTTKKAAQPEANALILKKAGLIDTIDHFPQVSSWEQVRSGVLLISSGSSGAGLLFRQTLRHLAALSAAPEVHLAL
jgi:hypothetical protein